MLTGIAVFAAVVISVAAMCYAETSVRTMRSALRAMQRELERTIRRMNRATFDPLGIEPTPTERRMRHAARTQDSPRS